MKKFAKIALVAALGSTMACGGADGPARLAPVPTSAHFVVRHSDYTSSAYSFLDASGAVVLDGWIHSGSTAPGLTAVLSGDTDTPSVMEPGVLTIIDRFGVDVVTRIDLATGDVLGQVRTQGTSDSAFSSNPTDVAYVSATSAWVTRYGHNTMLGAAGDVAGSDLLEINPTTMTRTGNRVDLASLSVDVSVAQMGGGTVDKSARVHPNRVVKVGGFLAVGLDLITDTFDAAAPGTLAIVTSATGAVGTFNLAPLTNCGTLLPIPGAPSHVAVVCKGWTDIVAESAVVIVNIDPTSGATTEVRRYASSDHALEDPVFDSVVMLTDDAFVGAHVGGFGLAAVADTLVSVDMLTGTRTLVFTAAHPNDLFVTMAFDAASGLLLVPDASGGIHRMMRNASTGAISVMDLVTLTGHGLPVVAVALLP